MIEPLIQLNVKLSMRMGLQSEFEYAKLSIRDFSFEFWNEGFSFGLGMNATWKTVFWIWEPNKDVLNI